MLNNINKSRTASSASNIIPDPWDVATPIIREIQPVATKIPREEHLLFTGAGIPNAVLIGLPKPHPKETLLQDWLKLKTDKARELGNQLQQALGLLYWVERVA